MTTARKPELGADPAIRWSIRAFDIDTREELFSHRCDDALDIASIGKVLLLYFVLRQLHEGKLLLEDDGTRRPNEVIDNPGLRYQLQSDTLRIHGICVLSGAVSDNAATNVLCHRAGMDTVHCHTKELGYGASTLNDVVRWPIPAGSPTALSTGSAAELSDFMESVARNGILDNKGCDTLSRWLGAGMDCSMVASAASASAFNLDPLAHYSYDRDIWLWNITGTTSSVHADLSVIMFARRRVPIGQTR